MDNKEHWQKIYGKPISQEEAKDINRNLAGFFNTIKEWDDVEKRSNEDERNSNNRSGNLSYTP